MGSKHISRRTLLAGAAASVAALSGCHPDATPGPTGSDSPAAPVPSVSDLIKESPFYIAHRGGWLNWPEMTAFAYEQATALPFVKAVEVSVVVTLDGILVCSHDLSTKRMTGAPYEIPKVPWSTLEPLLVTSAFTEDPSQPYRPLTRLDQIIGTLLKSHIVFIEPKSPETVEPLKSLLTQVNQPARTVWKQPINQKHFEWAKSQGFTTWGYALDEPSHTGDRLKKLVADPAIDMFGIEFKRDDAAVQVLVELASAVGKTTVMTNVQNSEQRQRAMSLGCRGLMTANIKELPLDPM